MLRDNFPLCSVWLAQICSTAFINDSSVPYAQISSLFTARPIP